jgi:thioredoxin reductase (NADPH)
LVSKTYFFNYVISSELFLEVLVMSEKYDVIVVGAGPAGLTAAIYCGWLGLKTVVLEAAFTGGRAGQAPRIHNFPGFPEGISGNELVDKMRQQAELFRAEFRSDEEMVGLDLETETKKVVSRKQAYLAQAVIIATGTQRRKLFVPGEAEFLGRGVSYCAVCDGPFFRKKTVAVIGNGEDAVEDALALADVAGKVTIVTQGKELDVDSVVLAKLHSKPNVDVVMGQVTRIFGNQAVDAVEVLTPDSQNVVAIDVNGVFVALGSVPMTSIVRRAGLMTDPGGCLTVNRQQKTNIAGVFAAGDCTCGGMQVVTAAGEGAMAAMKTSAYIRRGKP